MKLLNKFSFTSIYLLPLILMCSCHYETYEDIIPEPDPADTTEVSYQTDIRPILVNNCYECHAQSGSSAIKLDSYDNLIPYIENGSFLGAIKHENGFLPMPDGGAQLPAQQIEIIKKWIEAGYPDN
jgi:hypothetical protein